jgi:NAD(P)-dependent dehydrogenase (short-subunit alcohol dehydrogenase family)
VRKRGAELRKLLFDSTILLCGILIFLKGTLITRSEDRKGERNMARRSTAQKRASKSESKGKLMAFETKRKAQQKEPKPPFPKQHQPHPGIEADVEPRPKYKAALYRGADKLLDKVALITGGDSGIGRAVAMLYAREGADIAVVFLPVEEKDAQETAKAVEDEGRRCVLIPGDVKDPDFCREAVEQTVEELGRLDILVNNAAFQQHQESIEDITEEQWENTFRTNIFGYFHMVKAALPHLKPGSAIVNTGSITGLQGSKELLDYASTKGAIHAFTKSLAQNLVEKKIRVNCVAPGPVWTPLNIVDKPPEKVAEHGKTTPMERPAQPEEVAPAFVFFASEADSSYITGEVLTLLGGETTAA